MMENFEKHLSERSHDFLAEFGAAKFGQLWLTSENQIAQHMFRLKQKIDSLNEGEMTIVSEERGYFLKEKE